MSSLLANVKNIIFIVPGKGGVGKSIIITNLIVALPERIDAELRGGFF